MRQAQIQELVEKYLSRPWHKKFPDDQYNVWEVQGEGDDTAGPFLGLFEGSYADVLRYAVTLKNWATYGWGGDIRPHTRIPIIKVESGGINRAESNKELSEKKDLATRLKEEIAELEARLK